MRALVPLPLLLTSIAMAQCSGWVAAPWSPLRPDPTGSTYMEKTMYVDLAPSGPADIVLVHSGAGNHTNYPFQSGPDAYIDRGSGWVQIGTFAPIGPDVFRIDRITSYRGELIVAGQFTSVNGIPAQNIAAWNGSQWHALAEGLPSAVAAVTVHDDELFAAGPNSNFGIRRWNGTAWTGAATLRLPNGSTTQVTTPIFREYHGDLVAPYWQVSVMKWQEDHWEVLFDNPSASGNYISTFEVIGDRMMFGCHFSTNYPSPTLAMYDGQYHPMCILCWPIGTGDGSVSPPIDINGDGELDFLAGVYMSQYTCSSCTHSASESVMLLGPDHPSEPSTFPPYPQGSANSLYCNIDRPGDVLTRGIQFRSGHPLFNFGPRDFAIGRPQRDAVFSSMVTNVPPEVNYSWSRDGISLSDGPTSHGSIISGSHSSRLMIHDISAEDAGAYVLTVENPGCQTASSRPALLTVCFADFNEDRVADFFDYLDFVAAFADNSVDADFNGDEIIDIFDYLDFVQAFSAGCP